MTIKIKRKGEPMTYVCSKKIDSVIGNDFVEVSYTWRKLILIGFDNDLSKKSIFFESDDTAIYLPNGTIIAHMNYTLIPKGGTNSLLSTSNTFGIFVAAQYIYKDINTS